MKIRSGADALQDMIWLNEPKLWTGTKESVALTTEGKTDFWRLTHDGGIRDNGHFYYLNAEGDFELSARVIGEYHALYDQAGLMVRHDDKNWLKCGIEFVEGVQHISAVVTRDYSDWSVISLPDNPAAVWFRVKCRGATVECFYSLEGSSWQLFRQASFPGDGDRLAGLMAASPQGDGFRVHFEEFYISNGLRKEAGGSA